MSPARPGIRYDIEGLRALAVLAVVAYHADFLDGGFVGVDVFFVVSGFLITSLLLGEHRDGGRIDVLRFYARRIRRLLPTAVLVLIVTLAVSERALAPLAAERAAGDARAAATYTANIHFARQATDYLGAATAPSPFQHYWSLAVEEQFYLVWPLLLVALLWLVRRHIRIAIAVLMAASFAWSLHLTSADPSWAFFSLPTRAWELLAGAFLATVAVHLARAPRALCVPLGWIGLVAIGWSFVRFGAQTPFPGAGALVPVAGTVAILVSGSRVDPSGAPALLSRRPLPYIGGISYAWYLWHWPALVLAAAIAGHELSAPARIGVVVASGVVAAFTTVLMERPLRHAGFLVQHRRASFAFGAALTAIAFIASTTAMHSTPPLHGEHAAVVLTRPVSEPTPATEPAEPGAVEAAGVLEPVSAVDQEIAAAVARGAAATEVPTNLEPSLRRAHGDEAAPFRDSCTNGFTDARVHECVYADRAGAATIVAFGDSHAAQWHPALLEYAQQHDWRFVTLAKSTCPPVDVPVTSPVLRREFVECERWRDAAIEQIGAAHARVVVVDVARHYGTEYGFAVYGEPWLDGLASTVSRLRATGATVVVFGPTARPPGDVPTCLSDHVTDVARCDLDRDAAVPAFGLVAERAAVEGAGGVYVDKTAWLCTDSVCPVIVDNVLVYRDDNHLTTPYVRYLAPAIAARLDDALD